MSDKIKITNDDEPTFYVDDLQVTELIQGTQYLVRSKKYPGEADGWHLDLYCMDELGGYFEWMEIEPDEAEQIIPLELAITAGELKAARDHFKAQYADEYGLRHEFIESVHKATGAPEWEYPGQVIRDVKQLKAENERLKEIIRRLEWIEVGDYIGELCPACHNTPPFHFQECWLADELHLPKKAGNE